MTEKKKKEHTTFEVGPISESRMRAIMDGLWVEGGVGRKALDESIKVWYKPELIRKSKAIADSVKLEFLHAWNGYKQYAWGHDYLMPISRSGGDFFGVPFGGTIIENLDTLYLLEYDDEFKDAVEWVEKNVNFNQAVSVDVYGVTIRWLGGLLSGHLISGSKELLELARDLGNRLLPAFGSATGIPYLNVNLRTGVVSGVVNITGAVGPLMIEMGMLSKLTGDPGYYNAAKAALTAIYNARSGLDLIGTTINVVTGAWVDTTSRTLDYCEYNEGTIKGWLLFGDTDLLNIGTTLVRASIANMAEIYNGMLWFRRVNMNTGVPVNRYLQPFEQNYSMILALCGRLTEAREFARSCFSIWSRFGLTPKEVDYSNMSITASPTAEDFDLYPEMVEGLYHLYYVTGDEAWRQNAHAIFKNIIKYCKYTVGYTQIDDVRAWTRKDTMDPYFMTETLKYLYLLFADSPRFIYNPIMTTEAHILRGLVPT